MVVKTINLQLARKVDKVVKCGLSCGIGDPKPGEMCIEAAVCYAMGLPHSDKPTCVHPFFRSIKIDLNDSDEFRNLWKEMRPGNVIPPGLEYDNAEVKNLRAKMLRKLAIYQLGSNQIPDRLLLEIIGREAILKSHPDISRNTSKFVNTTPMKGFISAMLELGGVESSLENLLEPILVGLSKLPKNKSENLYMWDRITMRFVDWSDQFSLETRINLVETFLEKSKSKGVSLWKKLRSN